MQSAVTPVQIWADSAGDEVPVVEKTIYMEELCFLV